MTEARRAVVQAGGYRVFVEHHPRPEPGRGTILFVNGAVATTTALRWAVKSLTDFDLVLFDFPHFGASATHNLGAPGLDKEAEARVLLDLIEQFQPDYLISQSWGGTAALLALTQRPACVRRAIIACYSAGMSAPMRALADELMELIARGENIEAARLTMTTLGERLPPVSRKLQERYFLRFGAAESHQIAAQIGYVASLAFAQDAPRMAAIDIPVLIANGERDRFTPPARARPLVRFLPTARLATIPAAGHFLAMESEAACEAVCGTIRGFFGEEARAAGHSHRSGIAFGYRHTPGFPRAERS